MEKKNKTDTSKEESSSSKMQPTSASEPNPEETITNDSRFLLTKEIIETALKNDLGQEAQLSTFQIKDFTKPGDNYATLVTGIQCNGKFGKQHVETFYVAKLCNEGKSSASDEITVEFFLREGRFFTEIKERLNKILDDIGERNLYVAECIYQDHRKKKQLVIMKDLRKRNFRMFDRSVGVDVEHAVLVVKALARLHAAGFILKKKSRGKSLLEMYPYLVDKWVLVEEIIKLFRCSIENVVPLIENKVKFEKATNWLHRNMEQAMKIMFLDQLITAEDKFKTICHGDIWITNMMFRYNEENRPEEVVLLDLQLCRVSSIATDLNYFLFASMDAEDRKASIESILRSYYDTVEGIVGKGGFKMEFSFAELKEEYASKCAYGVYMALIVVPLIMKNEENVTDYFEMNEENMDEVLNEESRRNQQTLMENPLIMSRYLGAVMEGIEKGVFD